MARFDEWGLSAGLATVSGLCYAGGKTIAEDFTNGALQENVRYRALNMKAPIVVSDDTNSLLDIENLIIKFRKEYDYKKALIIIDNLQLVVTSASMVNMDNLKNIISRLQYIVKSTQSTIIVLSNHSHMDSEFLSAICEVVYV